MSFPGAGEEGEDISGTAYGLDGEKDKEFFTRVARGPWALDFTFGDRNKDDPTAAYLAAPLARGAYERDVSKVMQLRFEDSFREDRVSHTAPMHRCSIRPT